MRSEKRAHFLVCGLDLAFVQMSRWRIAQLMSLFFNQQIADLECLNHGGGAGAACWGEGGLGFKGYGWGLESDHCFKKLYICINDWGCGFCSLIHC